ncbi:MAG: UDP-N-acetylenolpyruvoylglucosamine reductase [Epulopiscium sp. Nuni2H_MBin003]|nr:MAG: UDP-N-acetylenolpyruvoylglucosamine reductase [Epulopiscium sp. Nuni2H_MBin003]
MQKIENEIIECVDKKQINFYVPLKKYTSFNVGGNAKMVVSPANYEELKNILNLCKKYSERYYILGNGSNILASDAGYDGVIILISDNFSNIKVEDNQISVGAGTKLSKIAQVAKDHELSGFEFAYGIPGTMGGAVTMNAGAYGGEIKDILEKIVVLTKSAQIKEILAKDLALGYRTSAIIKKEYIVLEATINLSKSNKQEINDKMQDYMQRRRDKQPLNYPSAGSTFKRPEGHFAGKLIEDSNLKGYRVGDAMVSEKHCGFVVNVGNATSKDIMSVIEHVKKEVYNKFGVMLEEEVKILV